MSVIDQLLTEIQAEAFKRGLPQLAADSGVPEDTLRRLLKTPPNAVENLKRLERIVRPAAA